MPGAVFGRDAELDRLYRLIDGVLEHGGALLVTGDPGIGKSTLLRAAAESRPGHRLPRPGDDGRGVGGRAPARRVV
jgi:AAA ATPase domain